MRTDFLAAFLVFGDCGKLYAAATACLIASLETNEKLDLVVYVPPTVSGELVKNFATKVSDVLGIPVSHSLIKTKVTGEQKIFENAFLKADNVAGAFTFENSNELIGKSILLIDDIFDSGATIKEIGKLLTNFGAIKIAPVVIAKTVGGDLR